MLACAAAILVPLAPGAQAANAWQTCIFRGSMRPDLVAQHEQWIGRKLQAVLEYIPYTSWSSISEPTNPVTKWPASYDVVFTTPMIPGDGSTLRAGAQGAYDAKWRTFAKTFIDNGRPNARIRLGHEFNHSFYPWSATNGREADFAAYYRRIVTITRQAGAKFRFTWNLLSPGSYVDLAKAYPGDAYVDVIGLDLYDGVYNVKDFEQRWQVLKTQRYGLDWVKSFAASHNKPIAFDEWALRYSTNHDHQDPKTNSGDNTVYINRMLDWFGANRVAYACYFDWRTSSGWTDSRILNGPYPNASATYRKRMSGTTTSTSSSTSTSTSTTKPTSTTSTTKPTSTTTSTIWSTTSTSSTTSTTSLLPDIGLVTANASTLPANDVPIRNRLVNLGKRVRLVDDDNITSSTLQGLKALVVTSSVSPSKVPSWLAGHAVPILNLEAYVQTTLRTASAGAESTGQTVLRVVNSAHPLAAGRSGDVTVQSAAPLASATPASGATIVARSTSGSPSVYGILKGAALTSGTAPARRVGFFVSYDSPPKLTSNGWAMFDAAVSWLG